MLSFRSEEADADHALLAGGAQDGCEEGGGRIAKVGGGFGDFEVGDGGEEIGGAFDDFLLKLGLEFAAGELDEEGEEDGEERTEGEGGDNEVTGAGRHEMGREGYWSCAIAMLKRRRR